MLASEEPREGESPHARFSSGGGVSDGSTHRNLSEFLLMIRMVIDPIALQPLDRLFRRRRSRLTQGT